MKKELLLMAMITASITTTVFAASNLDISATTAAPSSIQNSIVYGGNNKVEQDMFSPVKNLLVVLITSQVALTMLIMTMQLTLY